MSEDIETKILCLKHLSTKCLDPQEAYKRVGSIENGVAFEFESGFRVLVQDLSPACALVLYSRQFIRTLPISTQVVQ